MPERRWLPGSASCARAGGQSMTEYLVALAVVAALLVGAAAGDPPALQQFLDAVRAGWTRLMTALALPV